MTTTALRYPQQAEEKMSERTVRLTLLTIINLIALGTFLVLRLVDHHSILGSTVITGAVTMGFLFAGLLAEKTAIDYELLTSGEKE
jgi:multisubunit Na+/H+ antiporter MnhC subunit